MKIIPSIFCSLLLLLMSSVAAFAGELSLKEAVGGPSDFPVVVNGRAAEILVDKADAEVVRIAADLLAGDVERVSGVKPRVGSDVAALQPKNAPVIVIGTLGKSVLIVDLVKRGKLDGRSIEGKWESFVIATVADPFPGVAKALVIAGSDRRGTAYGVFEVSAAVGVSPWVWWADVAPRRRAALVIGAGTHTQGPPSVKYRGIFINDEDWGLQEWAEKNYEGGAGEVKDIGPKTYAKVFELLLRLKANFLWPAMHDSTKPFNSYPENKVVADRYAIVMGSSHAEPMLRNNVGEWPHDQAKMWNPVTNLLGILEYWEQRVRENGRYENVYTVGMRGIHDSGMPGGGTTAEKRDRMERIIGLQREMLAKHVNPDSSRVPQIFVPYKEVLELYQSGMKLPDDVTVVWPDDNFGYVRQLPDARERQRSGGHGVYYHISYWGRPHDYLWLESTAPALVWQEMTRAYEFGARQLWVVNVGDIKPIETGMTLFLRMAWDVKRYGPDVQRKFLRDFYTEQFGEEHADAIAKLKDEYFRLCAIRRPEHMGFNRVYFNRVTPNTPVQNSYWSHAPENDEAGRLLGRWLDLARRAEALADKLPRQSRDAYFQLVEYPARAGAALAEKIILAEKARLSRSDESARRAEAALRRIEQLTERYNAQNGGKWRGMMDDRPRRLPVFDMPPTTPQATATATAPAPRRDGLVFDIDPTKFARTHDRDGAGWRVIDGMGPRGGAVAVLPHRDVPTLRSPQDVRGRAPVAEYMVKSAYTGEVEVIIEALPTHPLTPAHEVLAAVSINDGEPFVVRFEQGKDDEDDPVWQANVLRSAMFGNVRLRVPGGTYKLKLWAADQSVVVQRITLVRGQVPDLQNGFINPPHSVKVSAFYYWLNNHISKEGVVSELHAMKEAGITRVFIGSDIRNRTDWSRDITGKYFGKVKVFSDEWWDVLHTAFKTASDLNSAFIVFRQKGTPSARDVSANFPEPSMVSAVNGPWQVSFEHDPIRRGPAKPIVLNELKDWTRLEDERIRYYSGTAVYTTSFAVGRISQNKNYYLDLGDLIATAKVKVNGKCVGGVWTSPYRVNVSGSVRPGKNTLEVEVINTWRNRLIGDRQLSEKERVVQSRINPWNGDSSLQKSGLLGPVALFETGR